MTAQDAVAAEVRAELARQRLSGVRAARALGWSQNFISVRLRGAVAFDVNDLQALAELLDVPVTQFFSGVTEDEPAGRAGVRTPRGGMGIRIPGFFPFAGLAVAA